MLAGEGCGGTAGTAGLTASGAAATLLPDGNVLVSLQQGGLLHLWRAPSWPEIAAAEAKDHSEFKQP